MSAMVSPALHGHGESDDAPARASIASLPEELLVAVLVLLDPRSLASFGATAR
jgi:hypothetical protein